MEAVKFTNEQMAYIFEGGSVRGYSLHHQEPWQLDASDTYDSGVVILKNSIGQCIRCHVIRFDDDSNPSKENFLVSGFEYVKPVLQAKWVWGSIQTPNNQSLPMMPSEMQALQEASDG